MKKCLSFVLIVVLLCPGLIHKNVSAEDLPMSNTIEWLNLPFRAIYIVK